MYNLMKIDDAFKKALDAYTRYDVMSTKYAFYRFALLSSEEQIRNRLGNRQGPEG